MASGNIPEASKGNDITEWMLGKILGARKRSKKLRLHGLSRAPRHLPQPSSRLDLASGDAPFAAAFAGCL
jgi:hypothetical protein